MPSLQETVLNRRSIRRFEERQVEQEKLDKIFEAVRWSPSWGNTQCWEIIAVKDSSQKEKLAGILSERNPATLAVTNAPVVLAICAEQNKSGYYKGKQITKFPDWFMYDLGIATQNICLTAHSHGLGSVIVGAFDHDMARQILEIPEGYEITSLVPIGYPAHSSAAPPRKEISQFVHYDRFQNSN
jgi:nitroreductase